MVAGIKNLIDCVNDSVISAKVSPGDHGVVNGDSAIEPPEKALNVNINPVSCQKRIDCPRLKIPKRNSLRDDVVSQDICEGIPVGKQGGEIILRNPCKGFIGWGKDGYAFS